MTDFLRDLWDTYPSAFVAIVAVLVAFISSVVWLVRNWHREGPTDPWRDDDDEWPFKD